MKDDAEKNSPEGTRAVIRAFQILECLCSAGRGLRITELTQRTDLNKATIFRMLSTLNNLGYVTKSQETDQYQPTMKILSVSHRLLDQYKPRHIAEADIQQLAQDSGQSVHFSVPDGDYTVIVEKVEARAHFRVAFHVGRRARMYATGTGKVFLAFMSPEELAAYLARVPLEALTPHTICDRDELFKVLAEIRANGYARDRQETTPGVGCVAAPIRDFSGQVAAAVSVTGPVTEIDRSVKHLIPLVMKTAGDISAKLGYQG